MDNADIEALLEETIGLLNAPGTDEVGEESGAPSLIKQLRVRMALLCMPKSERGVWAQALNVQDEQSHVTSKRVRRLVKSGALKTLNTAQKAVLRTPESRDRAESDEHFDEKVTDSSNDSDSDVGGARARESPRDSGALSRSQQQRADNAAAKQRRTAQATNQAAAAADAASGAKGG